MSLQIFKLTKFTPAVRHAQFDYQNVNPQSVRPGDSEWFVRLELTEATSVFPRALTPEAVGSNATSAASGRFCGTRTLRC